jgi:hypothetical protein
MNTEWGGGDANTYGTQLIQYMKNMGMSWTGWCYSSDWGPAMLSSENPEVRNSSGNLMYNACHDAVPVILAVDVKKPAAGSAFAKNISINNSTVQFYCAETSPVTLSMYAPDGRLVKKVLDRTFTKGTHSIRWYAPDKHGMNVAPGMYTVRLKVKESEYQTLLNVMR